MSATPAVADAHVCGACKYVMLDHNGKPRLLNTRVAHSCSHCTASLHSAMMCRSVWMPTLSNNGRTFCSEEHVRCWNNECSKGEQVPLQRLPPDMLAEEASEVDDDAGVVPPGGNSD
eukprot:1560543-Pleurochrysis_carterae.AAC.1